MGFKRDRKRAKEINAREASVCRFLHHGHRRPSRRPKCVLVLDFALVSPTRARGRSNIPIRSIDGKHHLVSRQHPRSSSTSNVPCLPRAPTMRFEWHQSNRLGVLVARHPIPLLSPTISRCFEPNPFPIKACFRSHSPFNESRSSRFAHRNP